MMTPPIMPKMQFVYVRFSILTVRERMRNSEFGRVTDATGKTRDLDGLVRVREDYKNEPRESEK